MKATSIQNGANCNNIHHTEMERPIFKSKFEAAKNVSHVDIQENNWEGDQLAKQ